MSKSFDALSPHAQLTYVEGMCEQALRTGEVADKFIALKIAHKADRAVADFNCTLGRQTLGAFITQYHEEVIDRQVMAGVSGYYVSSEEYAFDRTEISWINDNEVQVHNVVAKALGTWAGITIIKPQTSDEYYDAAVAVHEAGLQERPTAVTPEDNAIYAESAGNSLITLDYSIPGTSFFSGAVDALTWDIAGQRKRHKRAEQRRRIRKYLGKDYS
jgi:hypothetical protein